MIEAAQYKTASYVVRLGNAVTNYRNVKMQEYGLTSAQGDTMRAILHAPGITAAELKKQLGLSQSTVAGILARLEQKGLLEKKLVDGDARKMSLCPTPQGLELEAMLKQTALDTQNRMTNGMTSEEQAEFDRLLSKALANLAAAREKRGTPHE
ncbi:MAG TPA: MarR family transcriptional regulator [Firmicutes bacterium]|nr:MarR family transcriptional regulator [Bacillota bacterium]